jgi:hypothetical protein
MRPTNSRVTNRMTEEDNARANVEIQPIARARCCCAGCLRKASKYLDKFLGGKFEEWRFIGEQPAGWRAE